MRTLAILLALASGMLVHAQYFGFVSLSVIPNNPGPQDTIGIVCHSYHGSGPCALANAQLSWFENHATIDAHHYPGILTYICHSIDTVWLGVLGTGQFVIHYNLHEHMMAGISYVQSDSLLINLLTTGIKPQLAEALDIATDPLREVLIIRYIGSQGGSTVRIIDLCGKLLHRQQIMPGTNEMRTASWSPGIYILHHQVGEFSRSYKFLVIR